MIQSPSQNIPRLLKTISSRKNINSKSKKQNSNKYWPTQSSFTLLNKTYRYKKQQRTNKKSELSTFVTQNDEPQPPVVNTVQFMTFQRPRTCGQPIKKRTQMRKKSCQSKSISLFNGAKQQKLNKLERQKQNLMNQLHDTEKVQIHRYDEEQDVSEKPNSLNFKTYHFLNKLMAIREEIHHTQQKFRRPQTGIALRRVTNKTFLCT